MSELIKRSQGPCLYLSLNRPQVHNALNQGLVDALNQEFTNLIKDPLRYDLLVLEGVGSSFCAGADVREMRHLLKRIEQGEAKYSEAKHMNQSYGELLELAQRLPQTVITVAKGSILGGGLGLIAVADLVLCHKQTQFALPEAKLGLIPAQVAPFVMRKIGLSATRRLALCGTQLTAQQALHLNLVDQLYEDDNELRDYLEQHKRAIASLAPQARARTKALLLHCHQNLISSQVTPMQHGSTHDRVPAIEQAALEFVSALQSDEFKSGSQALFGGSIPYWTKRWNLEHSSQELQSKQTNDPQALSTKRPTND